MSDLGNALVISGIALMALSLSMGYLMYTGAPAALPSANVASAGTINASIATLMNGLSGTLASEAATLTKITILFLFGSIGYKFTNLGIQENKANVPRDLGKPKEDPAIPQEENRRLEKESFS
ncbi:Uncharacterised protein [uncultured archaeon]|nr:Uncharacterised protein [uncultured archaeon]